MYQHTSYFDKVSYQLGMPFADIFFATSDTSLDDQDEFVIKQIATLVRSELELGREPELTLIGTSDHRGNAKMNQDLSDQRLKKVAVLLGKELDGEPRFKYVWAVSVGEKFDVRRNKGKYFKGRNRLAAHRAVQVHPGKYLLTGFRKHSSGLYRDLPRIKRYELGRGFITTTPPAKVMQELLIPSLPSSKSLSGN